MQVSASYSSEILDGWKDRGHGEYIGGDMDTRWSRNYLNGIRTRWYQIDIWQRQIENFREQMQSFGGSAAGERVQTSPKGDALEKRVLKYVEKIDKLTMALYDKLDEANDMQVEAMDRICTLSDGRCKDLLNCYYVQRLSMGEIAGVFGYDSIESAYKLHIRALEYFEEMADKNGWKK